MVEQLFLTIDNVTHRTALGVKSLRFGKKLMVFLMKDFLCPIQFTCGNFVEQP